MLKIGLTFFLLFFISACGPAPQSSGQPSGSDDLSRLLKPEEPAVEKTMEQQALIKSTSEKLQMNEVTLLFEPGQKKLLVSIPLSFNSEEFTHITVRKPVMTTENCREQDIEFPIVMGIIGPLLQLREDIADKSSDVGMGYDVRERIDKGTDQAVIIQLYVPPICTKVHLSFETFFD